MADHTLSTRVSRRSMLASGAAAVLCAAPGIAASSSGAPSPTPPPHAGEGLHIASSKEEALSRLRGRVGRGSDARLTLLAGEYRRVLAALHAWIDLAEVRDGICAWCGPPWQARHDALAARADGLVAEIALLRPDSIYGLAVKLRAGVYYDYAGEIPLECDQRLLGPVLDDLDRMAEAVLFGVG